MGRENSSRTKKLFLLSIFYTLHCKACGSAFCNFHRLGVPEQALGEIPLGFGFLWKIILIIMFMDIGPQQMYTCDNLLRW